MRRELVSRTSERPQFTLDTGHERHLFVLRKKRALAGVQHDALQLIGRETEHRVGQEILVRQRDAVRQRAIGIECDHDALLVIALKGMLRHRSHDMRMHVAREAHFERNLAGDDFLQQRRVFGEPGAMPDSLGPDLVQRLVNRLRSVAFPRVTRAGHPVRGCVLECGAMLACGMPTLRAGEIECRHACAVWSTDSVISYFWRYSSRLFASRTSIALARASAVSAGNRMPWARAISIIVAGLGAPSRCTCSSALGHCRNASLV